MVSKSLLFITGFSVEYDLAHFLGLQFGQYFTETFYSVIDIFLFIGLIVKKEHISIFSQRET
jgi:hypothetical protein